MDSWLNPALFRSQNHEYNHAGAGQNERQRDERNGQPTSPAPTHDRGSVKFLAGLK